MQTFTKLISLCLLLGVLSSASCEKDPEPEQDPKQLIVGTWQRTNLEFANNGNWRQATTNCLLDDTEEFTADGKWIYSPGTDICAGTGNATGTYRFAEGDTKIIFTYTHAAGEYTRTIDLLDGQNMILFHEVGDINHTQARFNYVKR